MSDLLLTVTEAAELLRVHPKSIRRWIRQGRLRCLRAGGRVLLSRDSLLSWAAGLPEKAGRSATRA